MKEPAAPERTGACFAQRCGLHDAARAAAIDALLGRIESERIERVRIGWCDLHGQLRGKTLVGRAVDDALHDGLGMVSTLMLRDTGDRTAIAIFDPAAPGRPPGFGSADNLLLLPDPESFVVLPWAEGTGWLRGETWFHDATPVAIDPRRVLQRALGKLAARGWSLRCGLEVEFHVYRIVDARLDPADADWPGAAPEVTLLHPGYNLLAEAHADACDDVLRIVQRTCTALGLPLRSLEIELGPSQFEAVFDAADALVSADRMVLFRNGVKQALRRAGYHATFVCRPPFASVMSSGWHLHQSLVDADGRNVMARPSPQRGSTPQDAAHVLSDTGAAWLAGLLEHARGACAFATPTINGYGRFRPHAMAPCRVVWGRDNRGALLRVVGVAGDVATRLENRGGEPAANPYLYVAAQVLAGLDGIERGLVPPSATASPYADDAALASLPRSLPEALDALAADATLVDGFGAGFIDLYTRIKRSEIARHDAAADRDEWQRREYFARL